MFWQSYECFSILCNAFLLKSAIYSHNSCEELVGISESCPIKCECVHIMWFLDFCHTNSY